MNYTPTPPPHVFAHLDYRCSPFPQLTMWLELQLQGIGCKGAFLVLHSLC